MQSSSNPFIPFGFILGAALIVATAIGAWSVFAVRALDNTLSVTGSAKTEVMSDSVKFTFMISRIVPMSELAQGTAKLDADLAQVQAYLAAQQVPAEEITVDPVMTNQMYEPNGGTVTRYQVTRSIIVNSTRVDAIGGLAANLSSGLSAKGVIVQANMPEYYYSKLADLRVSLLSDAIKDAKARAEAIAKEGNQHVGRLRSSSSGVVQILAPNSIDVSDYGQYDTSSVKKVIMVSVRSTFDLK